MLSHQTRRKFTAHAKSQIGGWLLVDAVEAIIEDGRSHKLDALLELYTIHTLRAEDWYPAQFVLDVYRTLLDAERFGSQRLMSLGISVAEALVVPVQYTSAPEVFGNLDAIYGLNVRHHPPEEGFEAALRSEHHVEVVDRTPFPHDLVYGLMCSLVNRYAPSTSSPLVAYTYLDLSIPNNNGATYDIRW